MKYSIEQLSIPGTRIPDSEYKYKIINWGEEFEAKMFRNLISYSKRTQFGKEYILAEYIDYAGSYHYMIPISEFEKLENIFEIDGKQAQEIIDISCISWKKII